MINKQLEIIHAFNAIVNEKPPGYYKQKPLPLTAIDLLFELKKIGTEPILAEKEYWRKRYLKEAFKNIPTLEDMEKNHESKQ